MEKIGVGLEVIGNLMVMVGNDEVKVVGLVRTEGVGGKTVEA